MAEPKTANPELASICQRLGLEAPMDLQKGLTSAQVRESRRLCGRNELPKDKPKPFIYFVAKEFGQPLIVILMILLAISIYQIVNAVQINDQRVLAGKAPQPMDPDRPVKIAIIIFVVLVVVIFNAIGKSNTGRALKELAQLAGSSQVQVRRDGRLKEVPVEELVVGDVVIVRSGDAVPADLVVIEASDLSTIEATLTGEPSAVKKTTKAADETAAFRTDILYSSTDVVSGSGLGVCRAVGVSTAVGVIAQKLNKVEAVESPIERTMRQLGLGLIAITIVALIAIGLEIWKSQQYDLAKYQNQEFVAVLFESLSLATICLPTTLYLAVSISMQKGLLTLRRKNAVLRKFTAVESLGCTTVICSDKTGTLTEGKMTAVCCCPLSAAVDGAPKPAPCALYPTRGFNPVGGLFLESELEQGRAAIDALVEPGRPLDSKLSARLAQQGVHNLGDPQSAGAEGPLPRALLGAAFLNSDPATTMMRQGEAYVCVGNMSEAALVVAGAKVGLWARSNELLGEPYEDGRSAYPAAKELEVPFTSDRKMKMTAHRCDSGSLLGIALPAGVQHVALLKGAPDRLEPHITSLFTSDLSGVTAVDDRHLAEMRSRNLEYARQGLRVLTVAMLPLTDADIGELKGMEDADDRLKWALRKGFVLLGFVGLEDPPREGVREAVEQCHAAGIKVVMITGDQLATAASISKKICIVRDGEPADAMSEDCRALHEDPNHPATSDFIEDAKSDEKTGLITVWARAQPIDKIAIVESLQRQGNTVAMTGDGVNDAPALKAADMGTAMGISGTAVAKNAADMILLDDNFTTIVTAVRAGRQIYGNLQKYIYFYLGVKLCELVMFCICVFAQVFKPVAGIRALLGKSITHDTSPQTLPFEEPEPYQMKSPPRSRSEFILTRLLWWTRLVPQVFYFQVFVLGTSLIGAKLYTNSVNPKIATDSVSKWANSDAMCLQAYRCKFDSAGAASGCKKQDYYLFCRAPIDQSTRDSRQWLMEYGSFNDTFRLKDDKTAVNSDEMTWQLSNGHHDISNSQRTWIPIDATAMLYNLSIAGGAPFLAVTRCSGSGNKVLTNPAASVPSDHKNLCWTPEAVRKFGSDNEWYPYLDSSLNVGAWGIRKANGAGFMIFVMVELTHMLSCRTERFFWQAPHNFKYYMWQVVVDALLLCLLYVPGLNKAMEMAPADSYAWALSLSGCAGMLVLHEISKIFYGQRLTAAREIAKAANVYMNPVGY